MGVHRDCVTLMMLFAKIRLATLTRVSTYHIRIYEEAAVDKRFKEEERQQYMVGGKGDVAILMISEKFAFGNPTCFCTEKYLTLLQNIF